MGTLRLMPSHRPLNCKHKQTALGNGRSLAERTPIFGPIARSQAVPLQPSLLTPPAARFQRTSTNKSHSHPHQL